LIFEPSLGEYVGIWDGSHSSKQQVTLSIHAFDLAGHDSSAEVTVTLPPAQQGG
jgi:hypothetical protein